LKADNHFSLLGLPVRQQLDMTTLERAWHEAAVRVHPDRYAHASAAEKRVVMQWATNVNEAWQTLRHPLSRARYLCELAGYSCDQPGDDGTGSTDANFLIQQMLWREQLDEVRGTPEVEALRKEIQHHAQQLQAQVARLIDQDKDMAQAARHVREWMFVDKLLQEIRSSD